MKKIYFRADKRDFADGDPIRTAGEFMQEHHELGTKAESLMAEHKPDGKPNREDCLMLFEDEDCARRHWAKMSDGKLYQVEALDSDVLHRGDMRLVDGMGERIRVDEDATALVHLYWNEDMTDEPCVEVLVSGGTVVAQLGTNADRIEEFKRRFLNIRHDEEEDMDWLNDLSGKND